MILEEIQIIRNIGNKLWKLLWLRKVRFHRRVGLSRGISRRERVILLWKLWFRTINLRFRLINLNRIYLFRVKLVKKIKLINKLKYNRLRLKIIFLFRRIGKWNLIVVSIVVFSQLKIIFLATVPIIIIIMVIRVRKHSNERYIKRLK